MNTKRVMEICLYELIDIVPNLILALLPFKNSLRYSLKTLILCTPLLYISLVLSRILAMNHPSAAALLTVLWIGLYLGFYIAFVKSQISKLLFVLLNILNYTSFIVIIFSYFAYHIPSRFVKYPYSISSTLFLTFMYAAGYPVIYKLMLKMRVLISFSENNSYWKFLWMIPATFCLSYYYNLYVNGGIILFSANISNVLFAVFYNFGALLTTYLIMHLLEDINTNLELKSENYQLSMQFLQYENLKERIEDARRAKHDLRQNLAVIQNFVQNNDQTSLLKYLQNYTETISLESQLFFCENQAINALIVYYADLARKHGVSFDAGIDSYPADTLISDADAVVLLGNLLENALEACIQQTIKEKFIHLHIKNMQNILVITLDNSYSKDIRRDGDAFISSKNGQKGIGTASINKIASKYNGILKFDYKNNQFYASVMLYSS